MKRFPIALLCGLLALLVACGQGAQPAPAPDAPLRATLLGGKTEWRYWAGAEPGPTWREPGFDDRTWQTTRLPFGTTKEAPNTLQGQAEPPTLYVRTAFDVRDPAEWRALSLVLDYRDGAIVYLNGKEVARANLQPNAAYSDPAEAEHDTPPDTIDLSPSLNLLTAGRNTLAAEVHRSKDNSHLRIGVELVPTPRTAPAQFVVGPILGDVGADHITIKAESDTPAQAIVEFGPAEGTPSRRDFPQGTLHTLTLTGLRPGTTYRYRVGLQTSAGTTWSTDGNWSTPGDTNTPFRFAVWGDSRPRTGSSMPVVFTQLVSSLMQREPLAFGISVGDNVQLSRGPTDARTVRDRYIGFLNSIAPLAREVPFYSAIGNHDELHCGPCLKGWQDYFPLPDQNDRTYYSFDYGPAHLTILNSEQGKGSVVSAFSDEQWRWAEQDLLNAHTPLKFVCLHDSIYHEAKEETPSFTQEEKDELDKLFVSTGVTAVFAGHSHYYDFTERNGIPYIITGGAGSPLYEQFVNTDWQKNEAVVVSVSPTHVTLDVLLPDGKLLDQRTLK